MLKIMELSDFQKSYVTIYCCISNILPTFVKIIRLGDFKFFPGTLQGDSWISEIANNI